MASLPPQLVSFTYKDGPLIGVAPLNLSLPATRIGSPPHLHSCTRKINGQSVTAKGMYQLVRNDQGAVEAIHFPTDADVAFAPKVQPTETP